MFRARMLQVLAVLFSASLAGAFIYARATGRLSRERASGVPQTDTPLPGSKSAKVLLANEAALQGRPIERMRRAEAEEAAAHASGEVAGDSEDVGPSIVVGLTPRLLPGSKSDLQFTPGSFQPNRPPSDRNHRE